MGFFYCKISNCNSAFNFFDYYTEFDVEECISLLYALKPTYQGGNARLYRKIEHYQKCTERFGETDTLISYRSIPSYFNAILHDNNRHVYKRLNPNKFTLKSFKLLLKSFYKNIVFGEYKIALKENDSSIEGLSITRKIKPGDTRHLAFINLYRQGYHAVEIARLEGHVSIYSQSHYYNHLEAFVDLEILEPVQKVDLDTYSNKISNKESIQEHTVGMAFIEQFVLRTPKTDFKRKMIDGYCTYQEQLCPVNDCWECSEWWRISKEEFMEKQHILAEKIRDSRSGIQEVIENLKKLYESIYTLGRDEFYSSHNSEIQKELVGKSKYIDEAIRKYVSFIKVKERIVSNGDQR